MSKKEKEQKVKKGKKNIANSNTNIDEKNSQQTVKTTIYIDPKLKENITQYAQAKNMSFSDAVCYLAETNFELNGINSKINRVDQKISAESQKANKQISEIQSGLNNITEHVNNTENTLALIKGQTNKIQKLEGQLGTTNELLYGMIGLMSWILPNLMTDISVAADKEGGGIYDIFSRSWFLGRKDTSIDYIYKAIRYLGSEMLKTNGNLGMALKEAPKQIDFDYEKNMEINEAEWVKRCNTMANEYKKEQQVNSKPKQNNNHSNNNKNKSNRQY